MNIRFEVTSTPLRSQLVFVSVNYIVGEASYKLEVRLL